jgi:anti-anti-sigma factor
MGRDSGTIVLVEDRPPPTRPADLHRIAKRRVSPLVPPDFPLEDALIGLEEAYTNILEHAFSFRDVPHILVEAYWDLRGLNFLLTDRGAHGSGLTFPRALASNDRLRQHAVTTGGRLGLHLIRRVMDCLCYEVSSKGFNRFSMVKFPHQEQRNMEEELLIELRTEGLLARVSLKGYVNMDTSDYLAERVREFVEREGLVKFLIDARDLEYVSSAGVGVFIDLYDRYEDRGGRICFVGLKPTVKRVLELVGFMTFFGDAADESTALTYLNR